MVSSLRPQVLPYKLNENRQERETQGRDDHPVVGVKYMASALPLACGQPGIYSFNSHDIMFTFDVKKKHNPSLTNCAGRLTLLGSVRE